ncbi:alpha/beta hydrolase, partial [Selenomonadales bacterium OttesenSCG-928-I06]|nr:alpha/beta hydrolase [Selenomonadales bacterium OttesenSCG-928-I06]
MIKIYGKKPYKVAVIHGGLAKLGILSLVAQELAKVIGVIEPIQTKCTVKELISELHEQILSIGKVPISLIGHSWGAWLTILYATEYPEVVEQIILVGCSPLKSNYVAEILERRVERFSEQEQMKLNALLASLEDPQNNKKDIALTKLKKLVEKSDNYEIDIDIDLENNFPSNERMYAKIWGEVSEIRNNGDLIEKLNKIQCPVVVIHGENDTHPIEGVVEPLSQYNISFEKYVLPKCGHSPFNEVHAKELFYMILK